MKKYLLILLTASCLLIVKQGHAQSTDTLRSKTGWNAQWIGVNIFFDFGDYYSVNCYHKSITLSSKPSNFYIHVSADNHYKLFINGTLVSVGPARGTPLNWKYETLNIAPYLKAGKNSIAAMVWNEANYRPAWQLTVRTGFIIQGNTKTEEVMNTNNTWKCVQDKSISPVYGYFVAICGERVDMTKAPTAGWNEANFDSSAWPAAANIAPGQLKGSYQSSPYMLVPSLLPQRELVYQPITVIRKVIGMTLPNPAPKQILPVTIPANKKVVILLDQTFETNAFPTIKFSGGKDAGISLGYAEALFTPGSNYTKKDNRDIVDGKQFRGLTDTITSSGAVGQSFTPFNFRTYRYIQLIIQTRSAALTLDSLYGTYTAYPFKQNAVFNSDNTEIPKIREIGWRTAKLNAYETYMDCPYYEQLQYIADTRVQAMISYYESGDDRLARNALNLMDESRIPEGVTRSVYPSSGNQIIPPFSLWYIGMLHDYYMYRNDAGFLKDKLAGARGILDFFAKYQGSDGSVVRPPYWTYVDGPIKSTNSGNWFIGIPPQGSDGSSAVIDLQLLWAYQWAATLESNIGIPQYAALYNSKAAQLKQTIQSKYWDGGKKLYADTKEKNLFSQHANALAILTDMVSDADKPEFGKRMVANVGTLTQCNIYFKYYLHQALAKTGLGDDYLNWLGVWRDNMNMGLTTWAEVADLAETRSDCHGWGASPNIEFFRTILGIDSDAPGFSKVKIEPHLGALTNASGEIPHPNGKVVVGYVLKDNKWKIGISLPGSTSGTFIWKGKTYPLKAGENLFVI
ncbi:MAG: alpha-rhamnosidase [Sphingobacteriales bacterium]|nr:MAG: alpha-rhamnosidase [Sphingobacteriales bacterium]